MAAGIDVTQMQRALERMRARRDRLANLRDPMSAVTMLMLDYVRNRFASQGEAGGAPWVPLASATLREKARRGYPLAPLVRTGALAQSWGARVSADGKTGTLASDSGIAAYHQEGTVRMPARPMAPDEETTLALVRQVFEDHVHTAMEAS